MNKKNYITPNTKVVKLNLQSYLLDASIQSVNLGEGFSDDILVDGSTEGADSRRSVWDEEVENY